MPKKTVTVTDNTTGKKVELPILEGTCGPATIDVRGLYKELGYYTYDPGFMSTASCSSNITYIDGDEGILRYRGYPIEQLAEHSNFLEVCYLLLHGNLPTQGEMNNFDEVITDFTMLNEGIRRFFAGFHHDAHPMATMVGVVGGLSAFYPEASNVHDSKSQDKSAFRMIAKMPTLAAWTYKHAMGQPFVYPKNDMGYTENFLHMMFAYPTEEYVPDPLHIKALDLILILHADHEQNASTSTVRLTGSSEANPFAATAAGIASLWGPAHGGANEAVIRMLTEISENGNINKYVDMAKDKTNDYRLMGFGHRIYKNFDPRAKIIRKMCHEIIDQLGDGNNPLFETALELEKIALEDEYFVSRKLYPNVDFYSGIILRRLGIPLEMFTVIFAVARTVGWISHWREMIRDPESRIGRPRQLYKGRDATDYIPIEKRG